ncbi:hypothetical protein [Rouxiella sp. Mn2063]|uniref:hypothetical protein n=1 Tax=Rouxiella sp. Mn2063 TaxID=3395262 RepID=UPI003BD8B7A3
MSSGVLTLGASKELQNINISTNNGREFIINIYKEQTGFSGDMVILDRISGTSIYHLISQLKSNVCDIFSDGIDNVLTYLCQYNDAISDIHNPCNTPFIAPLDQNEIIKNKSISLSVRVN